VSIRFIVCVGMAAAMTAIALSPTIDRYAGASFAWHMLQHIVLLFIVPFFLVASAPFTVFAHFASHRATAVVVRFSRSIHITAHPAFALAVFIGTLWLTHFSGLYNLALEHEWVHALQHAVYLTAGIVFWLPVLAPPPLHPQPFPVRLLYLLIALPQGALLAFALGSGRRVLYAHYAANPAALSDQSNGAALMWIAGGMIVFVAFLGTLGAWAVRESGGSQPAHRGL
jgi:putative membrane protein